MTVLKSILPSLTANQSILMMAILLMVDVPHYTPPYYNALFQSFVDNDNSETGYVEAGLSQLAYQPTEDCCDAFLDSTPIDTSFLDGIIFFRDCGTCSGSGRNGVSPAS